MRLSRPVVIVAILVASAVPFSLAPAPAGAASVPVGRLAFVDANGALEIVTVRSNGNTTDPRKLAPVTHVSTPKTVKVRGVVVSADGRRLAWSEQIFKPSQQYGLLQTGGRIVVRNMQSGKTISLHSNESPLGFSGHTLVVVGAYTERLVTSPSPHLVKVHNGDAYAVATYADGIVDVASSVGNSNFVERDRLRLTTFSGHHTLLHRYDVGQTYRSAAANMDAVSSDGKKLIVERGNHQDFDGLGPSSLFDTYSLGAHHVRHQLGHYGTNQAKWRLATATFVGPHNTPWLAIHSAPKKSAAGDYYVVRGHVVSYTNGQWQVEDNQGIAVAGNRAGYVVVQSGEWQSVKDSPAGEYTPVVGGFALLRGPQGGHYMSKVKGTELVWVD